MQDIASRWIALNNEIKVAEKRYHRTPGAVKLLAVSKGQPISAIKEAYAAGQTCFAENYLQEALPKIRALPAEIEWHFIGAIQANKTKAIAENFSWVHSVDCYKIATRLARHRPLHLPPLRVFIQVNYHPQQRQAGISPENFLALAQQIHTLRGLALCGLMTISNQDGDPEQDFHALNQALTQLQNAGLPAFELSMGMSSDYELAIKQGATWLRIGSRLFGPRR